MSGTGKIDQAEKNEILRKQRNLCAVCNAPLDTVATHFDLVRPWKKEGTVESNAIHALCSSCHSKKLAGMEK